MKKILYIIITGTDPNSKKGGIGFALPGYLNAMSKVDIEFESIPTYSPESFSGKYWCLLKSLPVIVSRIISNRDKAIIIYSHAGAGFSLLRESVVLLIGKIFNAKTIIQLHAPEVDGYLKNNWKKKLFSIVVSNADRINVLLPWWHNRLTQAGIKQPISVLPNPLPLEWEKTAQQAIINKNNKKIINILALARIEEGKGLDLALEAMAYLNNEYRLTIAGEGCLLSTLKEQANKLGVSDRVEFTGWVSGDVKQKLFDTADIFCLPSSYDSFGMGFLEAMANGLPIVALDWGPISDIVPHGKVGYLIERSEPKLVAEVINKLTDGKLREKMGLEGKKWVLEQFSAKKVGQELKIIFEEMLKK